MHLLLLVLGCLLLMSGMIFVAAANIQFMIFREEVNNRAPEAEKITSIWWHIGTWAKLKDLYRRYDPQNSRGRKGNIFAVIGFVLLLLGILGLNLGLQVFG